MSNVMQRSRQSRALERLDAQLEAGTKVTKDGEKVPLTDKDIKRINSERDTLKKRI